MEERFVVVTEEAFVYRLFVYSKCATRAFRWVNIFLCEHF